MTNATNRDASQVRSDMEVMLMQEWQVITLVNLAQSLADTAGQYAYGLTTQQKEPTKMQAMGQCTEP